MPKRFRILEVLAFWLSATGQLLRFIDFSISLWLLMSFLAALIYGGLYFHVFRYIADKKVEHIYFNNFLLMFVAPAFSLYKPFALGAFFGAVYVSIVIITRAMMHKDGHPIPLARRFWDRKFYMGF